MAYEKNPDELGALWLKTGAKGEYMTGEISGVKVFCTPTKSDNPKAPAWRIALLTAGVNFTVSALNYRQVAEIRSALANGATRSQLTRIYGVTYMTIKRIETGEAWREEAK
jgi:hypothetical protein